MTSIIDTDVAIDYLIGRPGAVAFVQALPDVVVTSMAAAELYYGALNSQKKDKHLDALQKFLSGTLILPFTVRESKKFGEIKSRLKKDGKICGDFDVAIAATCLTNNATLITRNTKHYKNIRHLKTKTI